MLSGQFTLCFSFAVFLANRWILLILCVARQIANAHTIFNIVNVLSCSHLQIFSEVDSNDYLDGEDEEEKHCAIILINNAW